MFSNFYINVNNIWRRTSACRQNLHCQCLVRNELRRTSVPVPVLQVDRTCYNKCSVLKRFISVKALSGLGSRWFVRTLYCILMSKLEYTKNSRHAIQRGSLRLLPAYEVTTAKNPFIQVPCVSGSSGAGHWQTWRPCLTIIRVGTFSL